MEVASFQGPLSGSRFCNLCEVRTRPIFRIFYFPVGFHLPPSPSPPRTLHATRGGKNISVNGQLSVSRRFLDSALFTYAHPDPICRLTRCVLVPFAGSQERYECSRSARDPIPPDTPLPPPFPLPPPPVCSLSSISLYTFNALLLFRVSLSLTLCM